MQRFLFLGSLLLATPGFWGCGQKLATSTNPRANATQQRPSQQSRVDAEPQQKKGYVTNSIGMKLVKIPAGKFMMGSPTNEYNRSKDEGPLHQVEISQPFWMGVYEVTQEECQKVMGTNPSQFSATNKNPDFKDVAGLDTRRFPVDTVLWNNAVAYCRKMSELPAEKKAGRVYRLPTEAEWEYACRAGTSSPFYCGKALYMDQANMDGVTYPYPGPIRGARLFRTAKVGSYPPNPFGLHDMYGNVDEWCSDWYEGNYYKKSPKRDPQGPKEESPAGQRVVRGGAVTSTGYPCRSAARAGQGFDIAGPGNGFRVVASGGAATP